MVPLCTPPSPILLDAPPPPSDWSLQADVAAQKSQLEREQETYLKRVEELQAEAKTAIAKARQAALDDAEAMKARHAAIEEALAERKVRR